MSLLNLDLTKVETLLMEPLSFYAFSVLSLLGLLGLGVENAFFAPNAKAMHSSARVRNFWVPIANAGLSTGAIVMGMMCGLAVGFSPSSFSNPEVRGLVLTLFAMSVFVLALLYPFTWFNRSLFDLGKEEERKSVVAGIFYCLTLTFSFWYIDSTKFWYFIGIVGFISVIVGIYIQHRSKKRG